MQLWKKLFIVVRNKWDGNESVISITKRIEGKESKLSLIAKNQNILITLYFANYINH